MENVFIDVTVLEPRMKHPTIFEAFDNIAEGFTVIIHNDHDPKPLYYQLLGERGNCFSWTYLSNGPDIWEVAIKKNSGNNETVGEIAAKDMRKAELLKKKGIDFCCGGKKTLEQACSEKGLDVIRIKQELEDAAKLPPTTTHLDFNILKPSFLVDYIVNVHHAYVYQNAPVIEDLAHKVAAHHGSNIPALNKIYQKVAQLNAELIPHMRKEEQVLFPAIKFLESNGQSGFDSISDPIRFMEKEHDTAGNLIKDIRVLSDNYNAPEGSCNSLKMLYYKLEEFESDLLQHIHLENNILFPKVTAMEE